MTRLGDNLLHVAGKRVQLGVGALVVNGDPEERVPGAPATRNVRRPKPLNSVGLSIRYCRFGAVKVNASGPGSSCVATRHDAPAGGSKRTVARRSSRPRAHISADGMLMCACVLSTAR